MAKIPDNTQGLKLISRATGTPAVDLAALTLDLVVLDYVKEEVARRLQILPLRLDRGNLFIAAADPSDSQAVDEIAFLSGKKVVVYAAHSDQINFVIDEAYAARRSGEIQWRGAKALRPIENAALQTAALGEPVQATVHREPPRPTPEVREPFAGEPSYRADPPLETLRRARPRILVVDDEPVIRRIVQQALSQRNWEVIEAATGVQALQMVKSAEPDVILLDAMLPDVHGFDICKRLKASKRYAHIPVIMMTAVYKGWRMAADLKESYGVLATVEKPFDLQVVVQHVQDALLGQPSEKPNVEALSAEAQRLYREGLAAFRRNELDAAVAALSAATAIDPLSAALRNQLGLLLAQRGQDYAAMQELEAAVDIEPTRYQTLRNLAILYQRHGFRRKACELWERALANAPDDASRTEIKSLLVELL